MQLQKPALIAEQRQKLSPQMIQSIKLMAMPLQELKEQIQEEIEANPALEIVSDASTVSLESLPESEPRESENSSPFENSSDPGFYSHSGVGRRFEKDVHRRSDRQARDPAGALALAAPPPANRGR